MEEVAVNGFSPSMFPRISPTMAIDFDGPMVTCRYADSGEIVSYSWPEVGDQLDAIERMADILGVLGYTYRPVVGSPYPYSHGNGVFYIFRQFFLKLWTYLSVLFSRT